MPTKIDTAVIKKVNMDILDKFSKKFELKIAIKAEIKQPKVDECKKLALNVEMNVCDTESDVLKIQIDSMFVFELDEIPSDYEAFATDNCIPIIRDYLFDKIDVFLDEMGYSKLELSKENFN